MPKYLQSNFKLKSFVVIFLTPILLLGFLIGQARSEQADHLVISAVQITEGDGKANHDFIEIYNPTESDINLKGYRLVKRTKTGTSDISIKSWTEDIIIKAHSWRLWASSDDEAYSSGIEADDATKQTIASDNGIAIRFGAADTGEIVDSVAWGEAENIFKEGVAALALNATEVLVRNFGIAGAGNGEDTNNNTSDFSVIVGYVVHNSQSVALPVIENLSVSNLTPVLSPSSNSELNTSSGLGSVENSTILQIVLPVAEAGVDREAVVGENLDFDGSDSFDPEGKKLSFIWDFGDKTSAKGENISHAYSAEGDYTVILKINNGKNIGEDSVKVKINAPEFSDKIILSGVFPNPIGTDNSDDGEWIEILNFGDKKVNLKGWILTSGAKAGSKQYVFSQDSFIEAKGFLIVKRSISGLVLNNESGSVRLIWPADKIISEVSYGAAKEGKSYSYINNAWQWVDVPTAGKENLAKDLTVITSAPKAKENIIPAPNNVKNMDVLKNSVQEKGEILVNDNAINSLLSKNADLAIKKSFSAEDFLDKLIAEKVDKAILKVNASEIALKGKTLAVDNSADDSVDDNIGKSGVSGTNKEVLCKDFCLENENPKINNNKNIRENPWFYGDLILSGLCLFLVWRYQEIRKKIIQL